jgi:hypothetical protein
LLGPYAWYAQVLVPPQPPMPAPAVTRRPASFVVVVASWYENQLPLRGMGIDVTHTWAWPVGAPL